MNGWLRRNVQAKAKQSRAPAVAQVEKVQRKNKPSSKKASRQKQGLNPDTRNAVDNYYSSRTETKQETPVTQALAEYQAKTGLVHLKRAFKP